MYIHTQENQESGLVINNICCSLQFGRYYSNNQPWYSFMLQMVQAVAKYNKEEKHTFCCEFLNYTEGGTAVLSCVLWWSHFLHLRLHELLKRENVRNGKYVIGTSTRNSEGHCSLCSNKIYKPLFSDEENVTRIICLNALKNWLLLQLKVDFRENLIIQWHGALPHHHSAITSFVNEIMP